MEGGGTEFSNNVEDILTDRQKPERQRECHCGRCETNVVKDSFDMSFFVDKRTTNDLTSMMMFCVFHLVCYFIFGWAVS